MNTNSVGSVGDVSLPRTDRNIICSIANAQIFSLSYLTRVSLDTSVNLWPHCSVQFGEEAARNSFRYDGCTGAFFVRTICLFPSSLQTNVRYSVTIVLPDPLMAFWGILRAASMTFDTSNSGSLPG